jgi:hypothetical protein
MSAHLDQRFVVFDAQTTATLDAVFAELAVDVASGGADAPRCTHGVAHRVTRSEGHERRIRLAYPLRRDLGDGGGQRRVSPESNAGVERRSSRSALL